MMILIRLDSDDWLDIDDYVFYMLGPEYISDLKDEDTDDIEEGHTAKLIDKRLVFVSVDLDQCPDEIDLVEFIMILIRLDSDDWLDIDDYVFYMLGSRYISIQSLITVIVGSQLLVTQR